MLLGQTSNHLLSLLDQFRQGLFLVFKSYISFPCPLFLLYIIIFNCSEEIGFL